MHNPSHPGRILANYVTGHTVKDVAEHLGVTRTALSRVLHGHAAISAEMALELRTSLATISGYAQQLAEIRDAEQAKQLATDIAHEAAELDRSIGGFLTKSRAAHAAAAGSLAE